MQAIGVAAPRRHMLHGSMLSSVDQISKPETKKNLRGIQLECLSRTRIKDCI